MRFLVLGLNYLPETTSIGPYTADLAEFLQGRGHQVQVITGFPLAPEWRIWEGYRGKLGMRETVNGVPLLRTYLWVPRQPRRPLQRILFDTSFALSAMVGALGAQRPDLVVAISPPLQLGLAAALLHLLRSTPCFVHLQDLVPDAAVAAGILPSGSLAVRLGRSLERLVYRSAVGLGVIAEGFAENLLAKGVPAGKIHLLPNYIDLQFMRPCPRDNGFRSAHNIGPDAFVVMYSGSVAAKQGLETFVDAAACIQAPPGVGFYLVGEGPCLAELKARAAGVGAPNLRFLPLQPRASLPQQLAAADALVITQRKEVTDAVFPGKLLYYMAAGRPVVAAVNPLSETGRFVRRHEVGLVVPPEDPRALREAVEYLRGHPAELTRLGRNGRRVCEERFDRRRVLAGFAERLETLAARSQGGDLPC